MSTCVRVRVVSALLAVVVMAVPAAASTIQLTSTDSGFYFDDGNHNPSNENYLTGRFSGGVRHCGRLASRQRHHDRHHAGRLRHRGRQRALGGSIAFGTALTTLGAGPSDDYVFGFATASFAGGDVRRLDLTVVPEPATLALLAVGLATGLGRRRRCR